MGLLSWLFPGPEQKLAKAERLMRRGDPGQARLLLAGLEGLDAARLREQVEDALVGMNLEAAAACARSGEFEASAEHLALAERFADGRLADQLRAGRRALREARSAARAVAKGAAGVTISSDPLSGGGSCATGSCGGGGGGGPVPHEEPASGFGGDPIFSLPPDHPQVRYALLLEAYPDQLRERFLALGADFAAAVLLLEDGQPRQAWVALEPFVAAEPAVRFLRGRAALELGWFPRAASELRAFGDAVGHQRIGSQHTAAMAAQALASDKRLEEALDLLEAERARADELSLAANQVSVLEALGRLPEADELGVAVLRAAPGDLGLHKMLARIRLKGGKRLEAMQVLESGLTRLCKGPGKCGSQPLDLDAARLLASLYLEDRLQPKRAAELVRDIARFSRQPDWRDGYLSALQARNAGEPSATDLAHELLRRLKDGDPRRGLVERNLLQS